MINHKVYIGQTTDLVNRRASHRYKSTFEKNKFYNAVRKYGWEAFDFSVIAQLEANTLDELTDMLDSLEIKYIEQYNSFKKGYNSTAGGHCYRGKEVSEEFREYCRNRTYSAETRKKMGIAAKNRKVSAETRKKCSENAKRRNFGSYRELTTEKRNAGIRKALAKPILQIDREGNIINEFSSMKEAAKYIVDNIAKNRKKSGIEHGIHRHCHNLTKSDFYYGFKWEFKAMSN